MKARMRHSRSTPRSTRRTRTSLRFAALLCAFSSIWLAQPAHAYDLWQAYQDAQKNDPTYLASAAQNDVLNAQKSQVRAAVLPTVTLSGGVYNTRKQFWGETKAVNSRTHPASLTVGLNQPIFALDKLTALKQVDVQSSIVELKIAQAKQELITRVVQAYFSAWLTEHNARVADNVAKAAERQLEMAKKNFEIGNTTVIDTQEAETVWHNAQASLINAHTTWDNAKSALELLTGRAINEPLSNIRAPLKLKMPVPGSADSWVEQAKQNNYNVQIAQLNYRFNTLDTTRIGQKRLPQINVVAKRTWGNTNLQREPDEQSAVTTVGLELSMPIFDGGLIGGQVREAQAQENISFQTLRATQQNVAQSTRAAYNQAVSGLATINALESARGAAQKSADSNILGYQLGMRINIDVLNAQNAYAQAQYNLAQAQYNTILGNVNLKAAIGQLGDDDVQYINALLSHANTSDSSDTNNSNAQQTLPKK